MDFTKSKVHQNYVLIFNFNLQLNHVVLEEYFIIIYSYRLIKSEQVCFVVDKYYNKILNAKFPNFPKDIIKNYLK